MGSPFASSHPGIRQTIGFFANTLVLRVDLNGNPAYRDVVKSVDRVTLRAIANAELSLEKIVEAVQPPLDRSRTPLFQVSFRGRTQPYAALQLDGLAVERPEFIDNGSAKFDLALELEVTTGRCFLEYCTDLFAEQTIVQMEQDYQQLLDDLIHHPAAPFSEITTVAEIKKRCRPRAT